MQKKLPFEKVIGATAQIMFVLLLFVSPAYPAQVPFEEVKAYLENTVQLHEPEDKSIKTEAYDYSAVNIVPLWQKLGIQFAPLREKDETYVFGCKPDYQECFLPEPKADVIEHKDT